MGNKALGRDLGDLLSRARPSRLVDKVAPGHRAVSAPAPGAVVPPGDGSAASDAVRDPAGSQETPALTSAAPTSELALDGRVSPHVPDARGGGAEPLAGAPSRPYVTAPAPAPSVTWARGSVRWGVVCFLLDAVFLAGSVWLMRVDPWTRGTTTAVAVGLVLVGALFALAGVACLRYRPVRTPRIGEGGARIRVQLKQ